ncbi:MAG: hypothetical protein RLZZ618_4236 [Pseudomonadota bacterium]
MRPVEEKVYRRDGLREPVQYFGDEDFDQPPLSQLAALLGAALPLGVHELQVNKFRVIDIFPQRLQEGTEGAMTGAFASMGYSVFFSSARSLTQDNITCFISGSLDSRAIVQSASVPYKLSPMAGMVKNDAALKAAANECLGMLAAKLAKSSSESRIN